MVLRDKVWEALVTLDVDTQLIEGIKSLYQKSIAVVRVNDLRTKPFQVSRGLRQGCPLSPLLFIATFDQVLKHMQQQKLGFNLENDVFLNTLAFADDTVLVGLDKNEIKSLLELFERKCVDLGFKINVKKTKYMVIHRFLDVDLDVKLMVRGEEIERVKNFQYLGSMLSEVGDSGVELDERFKKVGKAFGAYSRFINNRRGLSINSKMKIVRGVFVPSVKYSLETVCLKKDEERRLDVTQMKWLRRVCGVSLLNRLHNEIIRVNCDMEPKLSSIVRSEQLRYAGHILRMNENRFPKKLLFWLPPVEWKRPQGLYPKRWWDVVRQTLKTVGIYAKLGFGDDLQLIEAYAENRTEWRNAVYRIRAEIDDEITLSTPTEPLGTAPAVPPPVRPPGSALYIQSLGFSLSVCREVT